jgi:CBS domain-containing protein
MANRTVRDSMTANPKTVSPETTAMEAAKLMATEDVGSLPVIVDEQLVGIVTDRDLVIQLVARGLDPKNVRIADVYTEQPAVASPDEQLDEALERMAQEQVRRLPVVSDGQLVGMLAQADVARSARPESTGQMVEEISSA